MDFQYIFPILTLLIGWFLNSLTPIFQERRDSRKALGKAIADLLEIRHDMCGRQIIMEELKKIGHLSPNDERAIWSVVAKLAPPTNDLSKRYDEAVTLIASSDPLLGFQLRSKDYVSKVGSIFGQVEDQVGQPVAMLMDMETQVYRAAIPHLNEIIIDLARRHGLFTGIRTRRYITKMSVIPKEAENMLATLKAYIESVKEMEAKQAQAQSDQGRGNCIT